MMLLCARASWTIRSPGPNRWPIVDLVRRVPADVTDRIVQAVEAGDLLFELDVHRLLAGYQAAGGRARAELVDRPLGRRGDVRIARHAQIVVGGEADQLAAVDLGRVA